MKERPILFSAPMVRAILEGRKTQTRRAVNPQPDISVLKESARDLDFEFRRMPVLGPTHVPAEWGFCPKYDKPECVPIYGYKCPYGQPGDRLIVAREIQSVGRNYCAGSDGVIYSRARGDWRPLKAHGNGNGYPCVTVMDGSRKTTRSVHSLVCEAFYGEAPFDGAQVRHLDGGTKNSLPNNLAWGTQAENWHDRKCHGNGMEGEKHHAAKLTDEDRAHVRWAIERGLCSQRHAARTLGMTQSAIGQMMAGSEASVVEQDVPSDRIPLITLKIVSVRVERLQDISEADAKAEGADCLVTDNCTDESRALLDMPLMEDGSPYRNGYALLWESINGPGSWDANPWVWVVEFKRVEVAIK